MQDLTITQIMLIVTSGCFLLGMPLYVLLRETRFKKIAETVLPVFLGCSVILFATTAVTAFSYFQNEDLMFPYSTYIQDGTTLVEGDKVVEKLPDKFQEAVTKLRFSQNAYTLQEASVKSKLKGDGIQQDHTVVWLERPEDSFMTFRRRFIFVGVSHDISAKVEHSLRVELSEDELREMMSHFPGELRDPVMSTYGLGGYKAYGLGPATYSSFGSISDVCAIQLIKEKQMPIDIANQRQRFIVDEVDVFIEDRTVTTSIRTIM